MKVILRRHTTNREVGKERTLAEEAAPTGEGVQTMASALFDAIRSDIIRGDLKPGAKLKVQELAGHYGAGTIPVREALSRLATGGFVDARDQRGFSVRCVSVSELVDLHRMRLLLEPVAVRDAIENGDVAWESRVLAAHHRLVRLPHFCDAEGQLLGSAWEASHEAFHAAIVSGCTSPWLLEFIRSVRHQMARYRHISAGTRSAGRRDVEREHHEILNAVLARDADMACERLCMHFTQSTTHALTEGSLGQFPSPPDPLIHLTQGVLAPAVRAMDPSSGKPMFGTAAQMRRPKKTSD